MVLIRSNVGSEYTSHGVALLLHFRNVMFVRWRGNSGVAFGKKGAHAVLVNLRLPLRTQSTHDVDRNITVTREILVCSNLGRVTRFAGRRRRW